MTDTLAETTTQIDWRLPENRREIFQRFYSFHLKYLAHPGMVYSWLPAIAEALDMDETQKAWLVWLNGNTQNPVTSLMLLEVAPYHTGWRAAVEFWNDNFKLLEWDTDRRHQKSKFGEATERWFREYGEDPAADWLRHGEAGWEDVWKYARAQPYMGRLSAWSMSEYAWLLFEGQLPDIGSWLLDDKKGSQSHRNGLALVKGMDATYWDPDAAHVLGIVDELDAFADELLEEARERNPGHPHVGRYTMESALCTHKSWYKPNRRYPGVYADMAYHRLKKAEGRFNRQFDLLWDARQHDLPEYLRLEDNPHDPGLAKVKQNHFLETGQPVMMGYDWPDLQSDFNAAVARGEYGRRAS